MPRLLSLLACLTFATPSLAAVVVQSDFTGAAATARNHSGAVSQSTILPATLGMHDLAAANGLASADGFVWWDREPDLLRMRVEGSYAAAAELDPFNSVTWAQTLAEMQFTLSEPTAWSYASRLEWVGPLPEGAFASTTAIVYRGDDPSTRVPGGQGNRSMAQQVATNGVHAAAQRDRSGVLEPGVYRVEVLLKAYANYESAAVAVDAPLVYSDFALHSGDVTFEPLARPIVPEPTAAALATLAALAAARRTGRGGGRR